MIHYFLSSSITVSLIFFCHSYCVNVLSYLCHVKCIVSLFMEQSIDPFFILGIHREYDEGDQTRTETTYSYGKPDPLIRSTASHK